MRYRLTKLQIKMLAEGKSLRMGRAVIYPDSKTREYCQKVISDELWDRYDFFTDGFSMSFAKKNT